MENSMLFTIVIPFHNREKYLPDTFLRLRTDIPPAPPGACGQ